MSPSQRLALRGVYMVAFSGILVLFGESQPQISFHQLYKQSANRSPVNHYEEPSHPVPIADTGAVHQRMADAYGNNHNIHPPANDAQGKAHRASTPILSCPPGFELNGKACQSVHYVEGTPSCGKKTDLFENGMCITIEEVKPINKCPKGSQTDGKKCYIAESVAPEVGCPKLYELALDGSGCIKKTHQKSKLECPPGFTQKGGKCFRETKHPASSTCPSGYILSEHDKKDECVKSESILPDVKCKEKGSNLTGGHCIKSEYVNPQTKCSAGYRDKGDGWCISTELILADSVCPDGTATSHKGCVELSTDTPVPSCKKDFIFQNNVCRKVEQKPITVKCPEGYKLKDGSCIQVQVIEAERVCPAGTVVEDKGCWQIVAVPSSLYCEKGDLDEEGVCIHVDHVEPKLICNNGTLSGGKCKIMRKQEPDAICPPGSQLEGKSCISYAMEPATSYCKKSGLPPGPDNCMSIEKGSMKHWCPVGWKLSGDQCAREVDGDMLYLCPHGMPLTGKKCEGRRISQPELVCPKEYTLGEGGVCFMVDTVEAVQSCPPGYLYSGGMCSSSVPHKASRRLQGSYMKQ